MKPLSIVALVIGCALAPLLVGCSSISPDEPYEIAELSPEAAEESALIERMLRAKLPFEGFAAIEPDAQWRIGDELLFGVEYQSAKELIHWTLGIRIESPVFTEGSQVFVGDGPAIALDVEERDSVSSTVRAITAEELRAAEVGDEDAEFEFYFPMDFKFSFTSSDGKEWSFTSDSILASVRVYDENGQLVERQVSVVPETYLRWGFREACEISIAQNELGEDVDFSELPPDERYERSRPFAGAVASIIALFQVLKENKALEPILWKVIERPSVFSIIGNLGVHLVVSPALGRAELDPRPLPGKSEGMPAYRFPLQFVVNDSLALRTTLTVGDTPPPLRTAAGLIAVDGVHPKHADRRFAIRLLASRRGAEPADSPREP